MIGVAVAALSGVAWTQRSQESRPSTPLAINSAIRSGITFYAAAHVSYDYKVCRWPSSPFALTALGSH